MAVCGGRKGAANETRPFSPAIASIVEHPNIYQSIYLSSLLPPIGRSVKPLVQFPRPAKDRRHPRDFFNYN